MGDFNSGEKARFLPSSVRKPCEERANTGGRTLFPRLSTRNLIRPFRSITAKGQQPPIYPMQATATSENPSSSIGCGTAPYIHFTSYVRQHWVARPTEFSGKQADGQTTAPGSIPPRLALPAASTTLSARCNWRDRLRGEHQYQLGLLRIDTLEPVFG